MTPWAKAVKSPFHLEVVLASSKADLAQVFYDTGRGYNENDSSTLPVAAGEDPQRLRFSIAEGTFNGLRFDPLTGDGVLRVWSLAITGSRGEVVRAVPLEGLKPFSRIDTIEIRDGSAKIVVAPGSVDPIATISFPAPVSLRVSATHWRRAMWVWAGLFVISVWVLVAATRNGRDEGRGRVARWSAAWRAHPRGSIAALSLIAAV
ncbi:MAG: hypothetical protein ABIR80_01130, partial [Opitutaceae bacterium]